MRTRRVLGQAKQLARWAGSGGVRLRGYRSQEVEFLMDQVPGVPGSKSPLLGAGNLREGLPKFRPTKKIKIRTDWARASERPGVAL